MLATRPVRVATRLMAHDGHVSGVDLLREFVYCRHPDNPGARGSGAGRTIPGTMSFAMAIAMALAVAMAKVMSRWWHPQ